MRGILPTQNDGGDGETYETENGYEAENTVDEDGDAAVAIRVVTEFGEASLRGLFDC